MSENLIGPICLSLPFILRDEKFKGIQRRWEAHDARARAENREIKPRAGNRSRGKSPDDTVTRHRLRLANRRGYQRLHAYRVIRRR